MNFSLRLTGALLCLIGLPIALLAVPPGSDEAITERIRATGTVCHAGEPCATAGLPMSAGLAPLNGIDVYNKYCFACHTTGVSGAPVLGDVVAWQERNSKGLQALYTSTIDGLGIAMPPRGTCASCSDDELRATVDYLLEQAR